MGLKLQQIIKRGCQEWNEHVSCTCNPLIKVARNLHLVARTVVDLQNSGMKVEHCRHNLSERVKIDRCVPTKRGRRKVVHFV